MRFLRRILLRIHGEREEDVRARTERTREDIRRRAEERGESVKRFEQSKEASVLRSVSAHPKRQNGGRA